jgi:hypothetical protein
MAAVLAAPGPGSVEVFPAQRYDRTFRPFALTCRPPQHACRAIAVPLLRGPDSN